MRKTETQVRKFYFSIAADQFIVFLKIKQVLYERFVDDSVDVAEALLNKLDSYSTLEAGYEPPNWSQ